MWWKLSTWTIKTSECILVLCPHSRLIVENNLHQVNFLLVNTTEHKWWGNYLPVETEFAAINRDIQKCLESGHNNTQTEREKLWSSSKEIVVTMLLKSSSLGNLGSLLVLIQKKLVLPSARWKKRRLYDPGIKIAACMSPFHVANYCLPVEPRLMMKSYRHEQKVYFAAVNWEWSKTTTSQQCRLNVY